MKTKKFLYDDGHRN